MANFLVPNDAPLWFQDFARDIDRAIESAKHLQSYTVTTLPDPAAGVRTLIYVSDETGGETPAFSDGTNWRRFSDRAIVS